MSLKKIKKLINENSETERKNLLDSAKIAINNDEFPFKRYIQGILFVRTKFLDIDYSGDETKAFNYVEISKTKAGNYRYADMYHISFENTNSGKGWSKIIKKEDILYFLETNVQTIEIGTII